VEKGKKVSDGSTCEAADRREGAFRRLTEDGERSEGSINLTPQFLMFLNDSRNGLSFLTELRLMVDVATGCGPKGRGREPQEKYR